MEGDIKSTGKRIAGMGASLGKQFLGAAGRVTAIRGVKHPDQLIKRRDLYFGSHNSVAPNGQRYSGDYRELYFGTKRRRQ